MNQLTTPPALVSELPTVDEIGRMLREATTEDQEIAALNLISDRLELLASQLDKT